MLRRCCTKRAGLGAADSEGDLYTVLLSMWACASEPSAPAPAASEPPVVARAEHGEQEAHVEPTTPPAGASHFGAAFAVADADVVPVATFFAAPDSFVGKTARFEGRVTDVCQKAGCWMVMADGAHTVRVRMKDHAFSVAKDGTGATASVEGAVNKVEINPATVEHYASEATPGASVPEREGNGAPVYEIEATAVDFRRAS